MRIVLYRPLLVALHRLHSGSKEKESNITFFLNYDEIISCSEDIRFKALQHDEVFKIIMSEDEKKLTGRILEFSFSADLPDDCMAAVITTSGQSFCENMIFFRERFCNSAMKMIHPECTECESHELPETSAIDALLCCEKRDKSALVSYHSLRIFTEILQSLTLNSPAEISISEKCLTAATDSRVRLSCNQAFSGF